VEMYRVLKDTGSIYLHCDWHANAYIRVYILDNLFGENNFRNEIIWCYNGPSNVAKNFPQKSDTIFRYSKSNTYTFNKKSILRPYDIATLKRRQYAETKKKGIKFKGKEHTEYEKGSVPFNWWNDIFSGGQMSAKERIGYPTQKPEALLERIIKASSNEGDIILDPFVGGGTTVAVAEKLNRDWIGIDQSVQAVKVTQQRLENVLNIFISQNDNTESFTTELHYYDPDVLFNMDPFEFEHQIIQRFGGKSNRKQRGDGGIDGYTKENNVPIQVKQSKDIGRNVIDNFKSAIERDMRKNRLNYEELKKKGSIAGYIIAFSFGRGAREEVARLKTEEGIIIELKNVADIIPLAQKPKLQFEVISDNVNSKGHHIVRFEAIGECDTKIEFYSWDFNHSLSALEDNITESRRQFNADIVYDKDGKVEWEFSAGKYNIAVKVTDNKGINNILVKTLQINGDAKLDNAISKVHNDKIIVDTGDY